MIGINDGHKQWFTPEVLDIIADASVFSGGKRHHEIVRDLLPQNAVWIDITVPLSTVFEAYKNYDSIVVFASGDPLFFGFASTVMRECPDCDIKVLPSFNSLQMLAHRLNIPYEGMTTVSLTGRPWDGLDCSLISGDKMIGCLTDKNKTPHDIWSRLNQFGYDNYRMYVGVKLGNETDEIIGEYDSNCKYDNPNCVILICTFSRQTFFGIPDEEFFLLDGRKKMITKMPIRLCSLSALDLANKKSFWDVGFCTGSVSIEAKLRFPSLHVTAFEIRPECAEIIENNTRKFGAPGIESVIGNFLDVDVSAYPNPDAVFIGGHGGKLDMIMDKICGCLSDKGCIVFNSVSEESRMQFEVSAQRLGMRCSVFSKLVVDDNNPITILKATW